MQESNAPTSETQPESPSDKKWFHFRWQVLVVLLLIVALPVAYFTWRQSRQKTAIAELKSRGAIIRTEPVAIPFFEQIAGREYSEQIIEVYWVAGDVSANDLAALSGVSTLRKLELTNSRVESAGLRHIAGLDDLYTLHLSGTGVGDDAVRHVAELRSLEILSLNETEVTDEGVALLSELPVLERLFLNSTQITDAGLEHLAGMTQLKELGLRDLPITDAGLAKLKTLVNLEVLALDNNPNLTREGIVALRRTIPGLVFALDEESSSNPATQRKDQEQPESTSPSSG